MKTTRYQIFVLWFLGILAIPMGLIPSQIMNYLTGILQPGSINSEFSVTPVIIVFFLSIVGVAILDVIRKIIKGVSLEGIVRNSSLKLFENVLKASPEFFRKNQTAKISNRIVGEIRKTESFLLDLKIGLPIAIIGLFLFTYVLFSGLDQTTPLVGPYLPDGFSQQGNWFLATLIILTSPLQAYFLLFDKIIQKVHKATAEADDDMADISYETVNTVREFRNNYAFNYAVFRLDKVFDRLRKIEIDILKMDALFSGTGPILEGLIKVALLAIGARLCVSDLYIPIADVTVDAIEWKDYMGFAGIAILVNGYVGQLKNYLFSWRLSSDSFQRIDEFKKAESLIKPSLQLLEIEGDSDSIVFSNLDFETDDGIKILSDLNINIAPGEHIAFVGPSGCGKSTTLNLILREINESSGDLSFTNKNIHECDFSSLSREVAMVQQKPMLLNTSIRNNILLGLRRHSNKIIEDGGSDVDISRFKSCEDLQGLNLQLVEIIEKVALEPDITKKALDNYLPESYIDSKFIECLNDLRGSVQKKISQENSELLHIFNKDHLLYSSTLLENLLYGVLEQSNSNNHIKDMYPILKNTLLLEQLLWIGKQQFLHDQNIAMRIKHQAPALFDVLTSYKLAGEDTAELSNSVAVLKVNELKSLKNIKPKLQKILLELALTTNAKHALSFVPEQSQFIGYVLDVRNKIISSDILPDISYKRFDSNKPVNSLSLREIILGGQVNAEIRGAYAQVDKCITETLKEQNLINDLIIIGLESPVGEEGRLLSGGQAMKVAIARVLLKKPNILLLDEATAALDEKSQAKIINLIEDEYKDKTVIMISHRLSTIRNYSRVLVFDRGHVVQQGSYDELADKPGLFQDLVRQERGEAPLSKTPVSDGSISLELKKVITGSEIQRAIALSPIFSDLHSEEIALLEHMSQVVKSDKGSVLFERGDDGHEFFIILSGEVDFFVPSESGDNEIVDTYGVGQSFGELALFGEVSRTLGAKAKTDLKLCIINRDNLLKLMDINPDITVIFLKFISKQIAQIRDATYK